MRMRLDREDLSRMRDAPAALLRWRRSVWNPQRGAWEINYANPWSRHLRSVTISKQDGHDVAELEWS